MTFLLKISWRNMFRNTRRTVLASLAIGVGLAALIFTDALMQGMTESMLRTATDTFLGQGQIHAEGFRAVPEVENTVRNLDEALAGLREEPILTGFSRRVQAFGMLASAAGAESVLLYGIDPEREKGISRIDEAMVEGAYLDPEGSRRILVGGELAERLSVGVGDRVVVTAARAGTGELAQEMFRVGGIFRLNNREMDSGMALVPLQAAQGLLGLEDGIHEIVLQFRDLDRAGDTSLDFWQRYSTNGNEALSWRKLMPQLSTLLELTQFTSLITGLILFAVVSVGIVNTLFMSLYERMFEFGVLRAVGTRPLRMALMILCEAGVLSVLSIGVGCALGLAVTAGFSVTGIDYVGVEMAGVTLHELIYPVPDVQQYTVFPLGVFLFTLLAGIYPAVYAARLTPARAMQAHD